MLMNGLINITLNTLTIGLIAYIIIAYYWALRICLLDIENNGIFEHGLLYFIFALIAIIGTIIASPITYTLYVFSTMINIQTEMENTEIND